jgi:hypothetical protein
MKPGNEETGQAFKERLGGNFEPRQFDSVPRRQLKLGTTFSRGPSSAFTYSQCDKTILF